MTHNATAQHDSVAISTAAFDRPASRLRNTAVLTSRRAVWESLGYRRKLSGERDEAFGHRSRLDGACGGESSGRGLAGRERHQGRPAVSQAQAGCASLSLGPQHDAREPGYLRGRIKWPEGLSDVEPIATLHSTVYDRLAAKSVQHFYERRPYRPTNLASHGKVKH